MNKLALSPMNVFQVLSILTLQNPTTFVKYALKKYLFVQGYER